MTDTPAWTEPSLVGEIRRLLDGSSGWGTSLRGFQTIGSTNDAARRWAADGAPEGSLIIAEEQTAGKGRMGRPWEAAAGRNLLFSVILRPAFPGEHWGMITLAASVAAAETVEGVTSPYVPKIKWPNDILLDGRKCCGMLLETVANGPPHAKNPGVILGVGLNVNQINFPPSLEETATSLRLISRQLVERAPLFVQLLSTLQRRYEHLSEGGGASIRQAFQNRMVGLGERVTLRYTSEDASAEGIIDGIDETGGLQLLVDGTRRTFHAGDVTVRGRSG